MTMAHGSSFTSWAKGVPGIFSAAMTFLGGRVSIGSSLRSVMLNQLRRSGAIDEPSHLPRQGVDELRGVAARVARTLQHLGEDVRFRRAGDHEHDEVGRIDERR